MSKVRRVGLRAILILVALGSLCVSDSAGPRLLPLPTPPISEQRVVSPSGAFASPSGHSSERGVYMEMVAGIQYRPRDRHQHEEPSTRAPEQSMLVPLIDIQRVNLLEQLPKPKPASLSRPKGRAPPRLV